MLLWDAPVTDLRPVATAERHALLAFLGGLGPGEWRAPTAAPGWSVRDVALHLLDDDLGWLSRDRDGDSTGLLDMTDHEQFVRDLAAKNQRWIDGARGLSARVVAELLAWSGEQLDRYHATRDLGGAGWVSWASDEPVPFWFNLGQELTERWVHHQQMREAVGRVGDHLAHLPHVLRVFVWALPHQYRAPAAEGTQVAVDLGCGGRWRLTSDGSGRWSLDEGPTPDPSARLTVSDDAGWRWLTGAAVGVGGIRHEGPAELVEPLLTARAIIV